MDFPPALPDPPDPSLPARRDPSVPPVLYHRQTIVNALSWTPCQPYLLADAVLKALAEDGQVIVARDDLAILLDEGLDVDGKRPDALARLRVVLGRAQGTA